MDSTPIATRLFFAFVYNTELAPCLPSSRPIPPKFSVPVWSPHLKKDIIIAIVAIIIPFRFHCNYPTHICTRFKSILTKIVRSKTFRHLRDWDGCNNVNGN